MKNALVGDPKFDASQDVPDFPYAQYAKMLGFEGIKVEKADDVPTALDEAMMAQKPVLVEALTDPSVPMLPPHVSVEQTMKFLSSLFKGDSDAWNMVKQTYKEVADGYFPGK